MSQPLVCDSRYDFIVDVNHRLLRIQVKTATLEENSNYIEIKTCSTHTNTQQTVIHSYSKEDVDYFATYFNNECYLIPIEIVGNRTFRLRLKPTKNGQVKNINFAKDFTLDCFLSSID